MTAPQATPDRDPQDSGERPWPPLSSYSRRPSGRTAKVNARLTSLVAPDSMEAEQYRVLRHFLEEFKRTRGLTVIAVTSPAAGDGKSTTAINLAGAIAQAPSARVLLIDADLRRPSVSASLGLDDSIGPSLARAVLEPACPLAVTVRRRVPFNLDVLPAGRRSSLVTYEVLRSPRVEQILREARQSYDYVVVDTPPVLLLPDCRLISQWMDGLLLVVAAHKTPRKLVAEALNVLGPEKLLGIVFNGDDRPLSGYYGRYASGYGYTRRAYSKSPSGRRGPGRTQDEGGGR